jgi:small conductance mechanosensitive channel
MNQNVEVYAQSAQKYIDMAMELAIAYVPKILLALMTLIVGFYLVRVFIRGIDVAMKHNKVDESLRGFLESLFTIGLKALIIISVATMIGIQMTSFVAIIAAAGLAVGLALQGSLSNFAGGVLILLFKPFQVGDFIDTGSHMGTVKKIQIFNTILKTPDNKTVIIPNGDLSNGALTNFSTEKTRRVDFVFGIGYDDDLLKAKKVLEKLTEEDDRILKDPAPQVVVGELADSSVNFTVRAWVNSEDYWGVFFDMQEKVKLTFDKEKISIPYPQTDIHLYKKS